MNNTRFEIVSVNISTEVGTPKNPVDECLIDSMGVVGDAHAGPWHRQVSIIGEESLHRFEETTGRHVSPGEFAENITLRGLDLREVSLLDRFKIGEVELEVTQLGKKCHGTECAIFREVGQCVMPREGLFTRVVNGGRICPGDEVQYLPKTLSFKIITLSDRASAGQYEDKSGPRIREILDEFLAGKRWRPSITQVILPDDADRLRAELLCAKESNADVVITTGGTGIGPRDITPEVVTKVCDRLIPGIMEYIRFKYGADKPNALLSRSVAGVAGQTLVYALPGSVKAVQEYMAEILKTLEHSILMLHGLDVH